MGRSRIRVAAYESPSLLPRNFHDIRDYAAKRAIKDPKVRKKLSGRTRTWDKITGVCFHQTASRMGERPRRYESGGAHVFITRSGKVVWVHDFDKIVNHANGWNNRCVGIELDGTYEGVLGNIKTFWRPKEKPNRRPQTVTDETIKATMEAIRWIERTVKLHGGKLKVLVAHRQSSGMRRSDPGSEIWQRIVMPLQKELKLGDGGKGFKIGKGKPIPEAWNPKYKGIRY